jgi:hypothetical protein
LIFAACLMKSRLCVMGKALVRLGAGFELATPAGIGTVKIPLIFAPQMHLDGVVRGRWQLK